MCVSLSGVETVWGVFRSSSATHRLPEGLQDAAGNSHSSAVSGVVCVCVVCVCVVCVSVCVFLSSVTEDTQADDTRGSFLRNVPGEMLFGHLTTANV